MHTTIKGDVSVYAVAALLLERGERVLKPLTDNARYDLALDRSGSLFRIQVKTGRVRNGCVNFNACSRSGDSGPRLVYAGQVEAIAVYCPDNKKVYLVPIEIIGAKTTMSLRIAPSRNGQKKMIFPAHEFEVGS